MTRSRCLALFVASALAAAMFGLGVPAPAGAGVQLWHATATKAETLVDATDLGRTAAATPLRIVLSLNLRNRGALEQGIRDGVVLTPAAFTASYAPTAAQAGAVAAYLSGAGFTDVSVASNRLLVTATTTAAQAAAVFNTPIESYRQHGRAVYANT